MQNSVDISLCNYVNNTVTWPEKSDDLAELVTVRQRAATIRDFSFQNTKFATDNCLIASKNNGAHFNILMIGCYSDTSDANRYRQVERRNCKIDFPEGHVSLRDIEQL